MRNGTAIPTNIPIFLRRPEDRAPAKLAIKRPDALCTRPPLPNPDTVIHGGSAPVTPDFLSRDSTAAAPCAPLRAAAPDSGPVTAAPRRPALPWLARQAPADLAEIPCPTADAKAAAATIAAPKAAADAAPAQSKPHSEVVDLTARRSAGADPHPVKIHKDLRPAFDADQDDSGEDDDAAFQVTLPRSVIRQIRVAAAEEGTTHRAIILRALRAAGLEIPEGADVDRRVLAAKRRQQA